jgi:anion-transporting  ArsA/GET3 family ATPase
MALIEYLESHGLRRISKRLSASGALDVVATAVPGMKDILVLGKVKQLDEAKAADLILVDAPAAGHAITFLLSARGLLDAVRVGPIRKQATDVVALLSDPARCQVMLVTSPEETPVSEAIDTAFAVEDRAGVALGPIVVNGCYEPLLVGAGASIGAAPAADAAHLAGAAGFRATRYEIQREQVARLGERLPLPQIHLPFVFTPDIGIGEVEHLADAMSAGIEAL